MNGFKREQSSPEGAAEAHRPVREFFKAHLVGLPGKAKEKAKKDYQLVKQAFILSNTDGKEEIRTTVKLPAGHCISLRLITIKGDPLPI